MWEERFAKDGYLFGTDPVPLLLKHNVLFEADKAAIGTDRIIKHQTNSAVRGSRASKPFLVAPAVL